MQSRRQLITAQAALAVAIAVTAVITFVVVRGTMARASAAYHQLASDLELRDRVRRTAQLLAEAARRQSIDSTDVQRLEQLRRELDISRTAWSRLTRSPRHPAFASL